MTLRVLVVEDDPDFGESLAELLENRQCSVDLALSAEAGVTKFRQSGYDLSLVDFKLPGANGVEGFLQIRRIDPTAKVIIMSAYTCGGIAGPRRQPRCRRRAAQAPRSGAH